MPYDVLKRLAYSFFGPILSLEDVMSHDKRRRIEGMLTVALLCLIMLALLTYALGSSNVTRLLPGISGFGVLAHKIYGLFLIVFAVRFCFAAVEAFHRSYYYRGAELILAEPLNKESNAVSFEVASIVHHTRDDDITGGFLESSFGQEVFVRCGIDEEDFRTFLSGRTPTLTAQAFVVEREGGVTLPAYARSVYKQDKSLEHFLAEHDIRKEEFEGAAAWVMRQIARERKKERWWSRDELGRIPGLGKAMAYGQTGFLEKYGHDIMQDPIYEHAVSVTKMEDDEVEAMEAVLARKRQANVLLIGALGSGRKERIAQLAHKIDEGTAFPQLEHKKIFLIDPGLIVSVKKEKGAFEQEFIAVMNQAVHAGNIVIVFENMPVLAESAQVIGTNFIELLAPYLSSSAIQIIATAEPEAFHRTIETNTTLMQYFDVVTMHSVGEDSVLRILEQTATLVEGQGSPVVTYPGLVSIVENADRYFPSGVMPDKAIDLLMEIAPEAAAQRKVFIRRADVEEYIKEKTGVPIGTITQEEQTKLLSLEDIMKKRVVGQVSAIMAIANAMRRSRAGISNPNRPIGSFLFLGPTGVGKTETAKALAEALFNDENAMLRLDMSEYQSDDALERLIGSFEGRQVGRLVTMLRERQYGVLLLDEFEKTNRDVHDLFLQIFDEGIFTDVHGNKVSARNILFIATSNAGADKIWAWSREGKDVSTLKQNLVDEIIGAGTFKPELLNRFDDIVLFHPLSQEDLRKIAQIKLISLASRMRDRGIELTITPELVDAVAQAGFDPLFGARPMNRAIADRVEQRIADRIIKGQIKPGATVTLTPADIA